MALALLGYFGTMVTAFVVLMSLLIHVTSWVSMDRKPPQYPMPVVEETAPAENPTKAKVASRNLTIPRSVSTELPAAPMPNNRWVAVTKRASAATVSQARDKPHQDLLAREAENRGYPALSYSEESRPDAGFGRAAGLFDLFAARRF